jgi:inner membrane protein
MSPVTHLLAGWLVANTAKLERRDRAIVTVAGVIPDIDGMGLLIEMIQQNPVTQLEWWGTYHHVLAHNILFAIIVALISMSFSARRWTATILAMISFHLHLLGDILGARGPDYQWPIHYLLPFSDTWQLTWSGQWMLNSWPNVLITMILLLSAFYLAWRRGYSLLEMVSSKADAAFVQTLRRRFGNPKGVVCD